MAETRIQVIGSSASCQEPAYPASQAFNDVTAPQSWWQTLAWHLTNEWVAGHLASAQVVNRIRYFASAIISKNIKHAKFEGSSDGGASWTKIPASAWAQGASQYNGDEILFTSVEGWQEVTFTNTTAYSRYRLYCYDSYNELSSNIPDQTDYYYIKYVTDLCTLPQFNRTWAIARGYADKFSGGDIFEIIDSFAGCNDGFYTVASAHNHDPFMDPWNGGWLAWCTVIEVAELIPNNLQKTMPTRIKKTTGTHYSEIHMAVAELEFYEWDGVPSPPSPSPDLPATISHWKMNDNAANKTVVDSIGNNDGVAQQNTSVLHTNGKINGALTFNGSSDYLNCGSDPSLNIINPMSISAWVKLNSYASENVTGCIVGSSYEYPYIGYIFSIRGGNSVAKPLLRIHDGVIHSSAEAVSDEDLELGQWYFIVGIVDSITIKIYVNAVLKKSEIYSIVPIANNKLFIGKASWGGGTNHLDGIIDDVRVYNKVLSLDGIAALYNGGIGTEGPVPYVIKHDFKCFSEGETKMQKSFSLRFEAKKDTSIESTLAREIDPPLNLTDKTQIRIYARAIRTGSNFSIEFRNSNDYIITHTPNIKEIYKWQSEAIDISKIANADKDSLNQVKIKIVNADEDNIFWLDNILVK